MNRALVYRGRPIPGVYQRCTDHCNAEQCTQHRWQYEVELPPGPNGRRRRITKGGFLTGKQAADARDEILHQHRAGSLPTNPDPTLAAWLRSWLALRIERADLRDGTIADYRDSIDRYLILEQALLMVLIVLALTATGAWFGGQLFPPVHRARRRRAA